MIRFADPAVAAVFSKYEPDVRQKLLKLRSLIFATAKITPGVGGVEETLKWGQPSYLTTETGSGSTIRLDSLNNEAGGYAIYFHCQTNLVESFRQRYGRKFRYEGNRALLFSTSETVPESELGDCITAALTHHLAKRKSRTPIGLLINRSRG